APSSATTASAASSGGSNGPTRTGSRCKRPSAPSAMASHGSRGAELRERLVRVERKGYRRPKRITFGEYAKTWYQEGQSRRGWKPKTRRAYQNALDRLDESFGHLPLATIRPRDVSAHIKTALGEYAPATV